jgi:hypothetical protein
MEPRALIFMPDYGADPIWSADRNDMVELESPGCNRATLAESWH